VSEKETRPHFRRAQQVERIGADQARLRENMKALKGSDLERKLIERYTGELAAQEDQLAALRREKADLEARPQAARSSLDAQLEALAIDVTLP